MNYPSVDEITAGVFRMDFFAMCDKRWIMPERNGLVEALVNAPFQESPVPYVPEENLGAVTIHMLDEMRKEYPKAILVCHL